MGFGDIIIIILLALVLTTALLASVKRRKKGRCSCGCEGCAMNCGKKDKDPR